MELTPARSRKEAYETKIQRKAPYSDGQAHRLCGGRRVLCHPACVRPALRRQNARHRAELHHLRPPRDLLGRLACPHGDPSGVRHHIEARGLRLCLADRLPVRDLHGGRGGEHLPGLCHVRPRRGDDLRLRTGARGRADAKARRHASLLRRGQGDRHPHGRRDGRGGAVPSALLLPRLHHDPLGEHGCVRADDGVLADGIFL